jgi:hypothetical protein
MKLTRKQLLAPFNLTYGSLDEWDAVPLLIDNKHAGTLIVQGMEVHFAFTKKPTICVRRAGREMLAPVLDKFGMLTTKVPKDMTDSKKFVQRVGFKPTWQDEDFDYYLLTTLPWERKTKEA